MLLRENFIREIEILHLCSVVKSMDKSHVFFCELFSVWLVLASASNRLGVRVPDGPWTGAFPKTSSCESPSRPRPHCGETDRECAHTAYGISTFSESV